MTKKVKLVFDEKRISKQEILKFLPKKVKVVENAPDFIISFGGDGTYLRALRFRKPVLGVRLRPSQGDLCLIKELKKLKELDINSLQTQRIPLINVRINNEECECFADTYINRDASQCNTIKLRVDQVTDKGDGVIISNSLGSTGYNKAAGGPIFNTEDLVITPICSSLGTKPWFIKHHKWIKIKVIRGSGYLWIDGRLITKLKPRVEVKVKKKGYYNTFTPPKN